jgi:hypothetical protein
MERYVGVASHARSCTLGVMSASGQRLKSLVVETNESTLVEAVRGMVGPRACVLGGGDSERL